MLDASNILLCSKLCWHNRPGPRLSGQFRHTVGYLFSRSTNFVDFVDFGDFHKICNCFTKISGNSIVTQITD